MIEDLKVIEFDGSPRAGKGSIVRLLGKRDSFEATETGANYRTVAKSLLLENIISADFTPEQVAEAIEKVDDDTLKAYAASRKQIIKEHGQDSLYAQDVGQSVHRVAAVDRVRKYVKARFADEVAEAVTDPDVRFLAVDGRNLGAVVNNVKAAELALRMFITCTPEEAALREFERGAINVSELSETVKILANRQREDATRELDPVVPDDDAIDYWESGTTDEDTRFRRGVGTLAAKTGRQIVLDTTRFREHSPEDPRAAMMEVADIIVNEVLAILASKKK